MVDKEWIKRKLDQVSNRKRSGATKMNENIWRPSEEKESTIRLIKYPYGEDPILDMWFHYRIGGKFTIPCLERNWGEECPVCELGRKLYKSGGEENKKYAKKMFPTQRFFTLVLDRDDPEKKPKFWGFPEMIYLKLLNTLKMDDYADLLDPIEGVDSVVSLIKQEGKMYSMPEISFGRKSKPLAETEEEIKKIIAMSPKIEDVYTRVPEVKIRKILDDWINFSDDGDDVAESETVKGGSKSETENDSGDNPTKGNVNIDEAFDKALEDLDDI